MVLFIHGKGTGEVTFKRCATREEAEEISSSHNGKYNFVVGSYDELVGANVPLLLLQGLLPSPASWKGTHRQKLEKEVWKTMSDEQKQAADQAKAEKKAAAEAAKAEKARLAAEKKAAADQKKAAAEAAKAEKARLAAEKKAAAAAPKAPKASEFDPSEVITLTVEKNPKREGSASHGRFALYQNGMTVEAALAAGVKAEDLRWDLGRRYITISKAL